MGQISAHLAHEIRNPVGSVALLASTLINRVDLKNKSLVLEIKKSIWRVERIVKATLLFSKGVHCSRSKIDPQNIEDELNESISHYTYSKDIAFVFNFDKEYFEADFDLLCIVLQNFLFNAIDAIEEGENEEGIVEINFRNTSEYALFEIYDNGKAIENPEILFEPFKSTKLKGNGLGLALSLQIIEAHNGSITLLQNNKKGFAIKIPHA
nr:HAMP domain-containing sensor histidine kinase [Helicobacter turcicus]